MQDSEINNLYFDLVKFLLTAIFNLQEEEEEEEQELEQNPEANKGKKCNLGCKYDCLERETIS